MAVKKAIRPEKHRQDRASVSPPPTGRGALVALCVVAPLIIAGLVVYYLLASRRASGELGFPLDDSWIHVRFAQHLIETRGFSFNPGELTSTTTGALWTVLLALAYRVTHEFLFTSIIINGLLSVALCVIVYGLSLTIVPSRWVALVAGVTVAVTAPLPWWILSGMEPPLYAALAMLGILLHVRARRAERAAPQHGMWATVVFALAGLARPECMLLFPLAMADRLVMSVWIERRAGGWQTWAKQVALHSAVFAVMLAPLFLYNHRVTGLWLPSSFYSKQQWMSIGGALAMGQTQRVLYVIAVSPWQQIASLISAWIHDNALLIAPSAVGLVWLVQQVVKRESGHRSLLIPAALVVQPIVWSWFSGYRPADYQSQRYVAALNPLYLLLGAIGGWWILTKLSEKMVWARVAAAAAVLLGSLAMQPTSAATYALNVKNITEMQVTIARWVRDHVPKGSLLAVNDVGAIGVITDDPVLDLQGLVTTQVLPLRSMKEQVLGRAPTLLSQFLFDHRPDYLIIFPRWYPEMDQRRDVFTPVFQVQLRDNITAGSDTMVVYETVWAGQHGKGLRT
ncbi:MAG: hypothetical protein ABSD48_01150 [Armatimonadota bacterium]